MKNNELLNKIGIFLIFLSLFLYYSNSKYEAGYYKGYDRGLEIGVNVALDTVSKIIDSHSRKGENKNKDCKLTLVTKDTLTYFLSLETIIK